MDGLFPPYTLIGMAPATVKDAQRDDRWDRRIADLAGILIVGGDRGGHSLDQTYAGRFGWS